MGQDGLLLLAPERVKICRCCLPPDRVKLTVNSKKETNSRVKMGQGSTWASVIYLLKESKWVAVVYPQNGARVKMASVITPWKSQNGLLLFTHWQSQANSEQQERNKQQGQNGPMVKMCFCFYHLKVSKWSKCQDGLMSFTPWKSHTDSEHQERVRMGCCCLPRERVKVTLHVWTPRKKQTVGSKGPRVKMGCCCIPPDRVKLIVSSKEKQTARSKWAKDVVLFVIRHMTKVDNLDRLGLSRNLESLGEVGLNCFRTIAN